LGAAESRGAQSPDCKLIPMKAAAASNAVATPSPHATAACKPCANCLKP